MACARSVYWRRKQPDSLAGRVEEALSRTLYIVHQTGPTSFILKEEGRERKFKTSLGSVHQCSCPVYRKEKELCVHILWVLLKKFRVSRENPVLFQLGLVEREINEILHGNNTKKQEGIPAGQSDQSNCVDRRTIMRDDVCPICQEMFSSRQIAITYCKYGCGQNVHIKCMKIWAEHQKQANKGDPDIKCPICRGKFAPLKELCNSDVYVYKPTLHRENSTNTVMDPGPLKSHHRTIQQRAEHFISRLHAYPVLGDKRDGDMTTERMCDGSVCEMCGEVWIRGDWLRKLPCQHKFHRQCIDGWLRSGQLVCPIDGTTIQSRAKKQKSLEERRKIGGRERMGKLGQDRQSSMPNDCNLSLCGQGIGLPQIIKGCPSPRGSIETARDIKSRLYNTSKLSPQVSHDRSCDTSQLSQPNFILPTHSYHHRLKKVDSSTANNSNFRSSTSIRRGLPSVHLPPLPHSRTSHHHHSLPSLMPDTTGLLVSSYSLRQCPLSSYSKLNLQ